MDNSKKEVPQGAQSASFAKEAATSTSDIRLELMLTYLKLRGRTEDDSLKAARNDLRRLSRLDMGAEQNLAAFLERMERGFSLGKIVPNNAITLRRLHLEHKNVRESYNVAAKRYVARLQARQHLKERAPVEAASKRLQSFAAETGPEKKWTEEKPKLELLKPQINNQRRVKL